MIPLYKDEHGYSSKLKGWLRCSPRGKDRQRFSVRMLIPFIHQSYRLGAVRVFAEGFLGSKEKGVSVRNRGDVTAAWKHRDFTLNSHVPARLAGSALVPIDIRGRKKITVKYGQAAVLELADGSAMLVGARLRNDVEEMIVSIDNAAIPAEKVMMTDE